MTTAQDRGKVVSLMHQPPLPPRNIPGCRLMQGKWCFEGQAVLIDAYTHVN